MEATKSPVDRARGAARFVYHEIQRRSGRRVVLAPDMAQPERTHADIADPAFYALSRRVADATMTSIERLYALFQAVDHVQRTDVAGDIVECGVWRGGSSMLAALRLLEHGDEARTMWLYDTFEGMPEPGEHDIDRTGAHMAAEWDIHKGRVDDLMFAYAGLEDVRRNMASTGFPEARLRYVQGKVEDTIPATLPERIAVLRLDTDWYSSTAHELEHLYPLLEPGGILIIDDYGHWQGARRAVDEWLAASDAPPLLTRIDETGRIGVKPA